MRHTIKSTSKGHLTLRGGQGHSSMPAIVLEKAGDSHTFETEGQFLPYKESVQNLKASQHLEHEAVDENAKAAPAAKAPAAEKVADKAPAADAPKAEAPKADDKGKGKGK